MHLYQSHLLYNLHITKRIYIRETWGKFADNFCEHLRNAEQNEKDSFTPVSCHFELPNYVVCPKHDNPNLQSLSIPGKQKAVKPWNKNSCFNPAFLIHTESMRESFKSGSTD